MVGYVILHLGVLGVVYTGVDAKALAVFCCAFLMRSIGVSIVYHRYLSHRSFRTSRPLQFLLALYGTLTVLGGPLWWAATHRQHHRHADTSRDIHSPRHQGFIYAHCGWFLDNEHRYPDLANVRDLTKYPELLWLERLSALLALLYVACAYLWFGAVGVVWGFFVPSVVVLQMIHWVQSVSHSVGGYRRYPTPDDSRNHWLFGILSMGEGFHHNHHCFPGSARLGLRWWEFDLGFYMVLVLSRVGLVWDVRAPSADARAGRTAKLERQIMHARHRLDRLAARIDDALRVLDAASGDIPPEHAELRHRLRARIDVVATRARTLLVAGPVVMRRAEDELSRELFADVRRRIDRADTLQRIDAAIGHRGG